MTPKQIAIRNMGKMVGLSLVVGAGTGILLNTVPLAILGIGFAVLGIGYLAKMIYEMELDKAERLAELNKLNDR
jgi:hypothetical protein